MAADVPDVIGASVEDATATLQDCGVDAAGREARRRGPGVHRRLRRGTRERGRRDAGRRHGGRDRGRVDRLTSRSVRRQGIAACSVRETGKPHRLPSVYKRLVDGPSGASRRARSGLRARGRSGVCEIFEPGLIRRIESSSARVTMGTAAAFADRAAGAPARGSRSRAAHSPRSSRPLRRPRGRRVARRPDDDQSTSRSLLHAAGVPPSLEVASWAPATLLARLATRGYTVSWFRNVYVAALDDGLSPHHPAMTVEEVTDDTLEEWLACSASATS